MDDVHQANEDVELSIPLRTRPSQPISNQKCQCCWSKLSTKSKIFFILLILGILSLIILPVIVYATCGFGQNSIFCPSNLNKVSEPTFEKIFLKPINGSVKIGDMILDEFQFKKIDGNHIGYEPGDGVAFSGISEDKYRWPNAELPYE